MLRSIAVFVLAMLALPAAQAPPAPPAPLPARFSVVYVDIMPSGRNAMAAAFRAYRAASSRETGYERVELFEQIGRPGHYIVVEAWREPADLDAHRNAPHVKTYRDAVDPIRVSGYDERPYAALSVAPPAGGARGEAAVHVIAHVDIGGQQAGVPPMLTQLAEDSRKERGALRYDVLQNATRRNHFTVLETWASDNDRIAHEAAAHTRKYRDVIQPITGSPLDERVFKAVE
jgi:quinol monooxygenase YgiN